VKYHHGRTRVGRLLDAANRRDASERRAHREIDGVRCPVCGALDTAARAPGDVCAYCGERENAPVLEWRCRCGHAEAVEVESPPIAEGDVQACTECDDGEAVAVPT
jgi:hypothetical protein